MGYVRTGMSHTRIDAVYKSMKSRCYNPHDRRYKNYGGRGIKMCSTWLEDKSTFFKWAIEQGYDDSLPRGIQTLDRTNVNEDYSPNNCRFISIKEQENNRTNNRIITYKGESHTISEWAEITGIKAGTLHNRFAYLGWSAEKALSTKAYVGRNQFTEEREYEQAQSQKG